MQKLKSPVPKQVASLLASLAVAALIFAGCRAFPTSVPTATPTSQPFQSPTPSPSPSPSPTQTAGPTNTPLPSPTPTATLPPFNPNNLQALEEISQAGDGSLNQVAVSPDGRILAVAGSQGIWLLDKFSLQVIGHSTAHAGPVNSVSWSPAGDRLVTGGRDGTVQVWDLKSEGEAANIALEQSHLLAAHSEPVREVAWSPSGTAIASASEDNLVWVWEISREGSNQESVKARFRLDHGSDVYALAWHPAGRYLATGNFAGQVQIFDAQEGLALLSLEAFGGWINALAWDPAGDILAAGGVDKSVRLWVITFPPNARQARANDRLTFQTFFNVNSLAWSPSGEQVIAAGGNPFRIGFWDPAPQTDEAETRQPLYSLEGHAAGINSIAASPGGTLVSVSQDSSLRIWDTSARRQLRALTPESAAQLPTLTGQMTSLAWGPDNLRLATGGSDNLVRLWQVSPSGEISLTRVLTGHQNIITSVDWSADGNWLASGSNDNSTRVWNTASAELLQEFPSEGGRINAVAWAPTGTRLATGGFFRIVQVWDALTGQEPLRLFPDVEITSLDWAPGGARLAIGGVDGSVHLWDLPANSEILVLEGAHTSRITAVRWSPDNAFIASMDVGGTIVIWDANSGQPLHNIPGDLNRWSGLSWSANGDLLAAGSSNGTISVWDAENMRLLRLLAGHTGEIRALAWSPGGERLASAGAEGAVRLWGRLPQRGAEPLPAGVGSRFPGRLPAPFRLPASAITPDNAARVDQLAMLGSGTTLNLEVHPSGMLAAVSGGTGTWIYQLDTLEPLQWLAGNKTYAAAWSPDGRLLAVRELRSALVWDLVSGQVLRVFGVDIGVRDNLAWSPDSGLLAAGNLRGRVQVFDIATGERLFDLQAGRDITSLAWSPDGTVLAAAGKDGESEAGLIWLWDFPSGRLRNVLQGHEQRATSLAWSPDGSRLLSAGDGLALNLWDLSTLAPLQEQAGGEEAVFEELPHERLTAEEITGVVSLAWSPQGDAFLVADKSGSLLFWGADSGLIQSSIAAHPGGAASADWSADGTWLISAGLDGSLVLWDPATGDQLTRSEAHLPELQAAAWLDSRNHIVAGGADGLVRIFELDQDSPALTTQPLEAPAGSLSYDPGGDQLAVRTSDGGIFLFSPDLDLVEPLPQGAAGLESSPHWLAAWAPDGTSLAWNSTTGVTSTIVVQNLVSGTQAVLTGTQGMFTALAWSPDGSMLASGTELGEVLVWELETGRAQRTFQASSGMVNALAWSPDGSLLASGGSDGQDFGGAQFVRWWNPRSGRLVREAQLPFGHTPLSLAWSPDGALLASGDSFGDLQLLNPANGVLLINLRGHTQDVTGVVWTPDGLRFISSSRDGTLRVWGIPEP